MKKGDTARSTGKGKTKSWGHYIGTITKVIKDNIFVIWDGTTFEDQMNIEEVELLPVTFREVPKLEFSDGMIIHTGGELRTLELSDFLKSQEDERIRMNPENNKPIIFKVFIINI